MDIRIPPYSDEAEESVLGAMILSKEAVEKAMSIINHSVFYKEKHNTIFRAMNSLVNEGEAVDQVTVINWLKKNKEIDSVGGAYYITGLVESTPSAANIEHYANIVLEKYLLRKAILICGEIESDAYDSNDSAENIILNAQKKIFDLSSSRIKGKFVKIEDCMTDFIQETENIKKSGKPPGLETGFYDYDRLLGGLQPGLLYILAGRPSMGKTAFALAIAENIASKSISVGIISLESLTLRLIRRLVIRKGLLNSQIFNTGQISDGEFDQIMKVVDKIWKLPIFIDDSNDSDINQITSKSRMLKRIEDIQLLIIDHLQLTGKDTKERDNRNTELGVISRGLKSFAKEVNIPVLALSQLSRKCEGRMPTLSDLRDSGELEQNADTVTFIFRPEAVGIKQIEGKDTKGIARLNVAKNRDGEIGEFRLAFNKKSIAFENYSSGEIPF